MQTTLTLHHQEIDVAEWDKFVEDSPQGNFYHLFHYLSNLLPNWQSIIIRDAGQIQAVFPFEIKSKWGIKYAMQPYFAQYLGVLFLEKNQNTYKSLEFQKKAIQSIHEALPPNLQYITYNFAPQFQYDLPLTWLNWQQKTVYTYWVDISKGYDVFLSECASHVRREAKKAVQAGIEIRIENAPEKVLAILKIAKPAAVQQIDSHFFDALAKNSRYLFEQQKSACLIAYHNDVAVAGIIYFFFKDKMIYYQGSTLPDYKNSGAMTHIIVESVRLFGQQYQVLDFDGSMIEAIERFFRGFGAFPIKYSNFTLNQLPFMLKIALSLKQRF